MKVLLSVDTVGGVWNFGVALAGALAARGTEVVLATLGPPPTPAQAGQLGPLALAAVRSCDARLEWMDDPWADVDRSGRWLQALAAAERPDVIHLNAGYAHGARRWPAPVVLGAHSCVLSWWQAVKGAPAPASWAVYRDRVRAGLRGAARVVTPSGALRQALRRQYGARAARWQVIRNGRGPDPDLRPPAGEKEPLLLCAGRWWDDAKNLGALVRAAPRLPWPVCAAGPGRSPDGRPGPAGPDSNGGPGWHALGPLPPAELAGWMRRAAVFVAPVRYEPFGLAILEAALCGCALVLGDVDSMRELWRGAAWLVDPEDDAALVRAVDTLAADPGRRRALAAAALARARRYDAGRMAAAYGSLYRSLRRPRRWFPVAGLLRRPHFPVAPT